MCGPRDLNPEVMGEGEVRAANTRRHPIHAANAAPRSTAKSKRAGQPCRSPAVRGWAVCRIDGARGGVRPVPANPNWKHGARSQEAVALRKLVNAIASDARKLKEEWCGD